jgi:hypothetical protein
MEEQSEFHGFLPGARITQSLREQAGSDALPMPEESTLGALKRREQSRKGQRGVFGVCVGRLTSISVGVIDPRTNNFLIFWDIVTTIALLFTAFFTPIEVSFMEAAPVGWNALFLLNRGVDIVFILDIYVQLRMAFKEEEGGTRWITDRHRVAVHYLTSYWFPLDVFSVLTSVFDLIDNDIARDVTVLRAVRALRLRGARASSAAGSSACPSITSTSRCCR